VAPSIPSCIRICPVLRNKFYGKASLFKNHEAEGGRTDFFIVEFQLIENGYLEKIITIITGAGKNQSIDAKIHDK
jgi:hypothetical protein